MKNKTLGSHCSVCKEKDININNLSKTIPLGHGTKYLFWHEKGCKRDLQGAMENVDVSYWDLIGYPKDIEKALENNPF